MQNYIKRFEKYINLCSYLQVVVNFANSYINEEFGFENIPR